MLKESGVALRLPPHSIADLASTVYDLAKDRLELMAGLILVFVRDLAHETFGLVISDKVDGRTAESATGEASTETAGMPTSEFDEQIEFFRAVFEKVARTFVALKHVLAELAVIVVAQCAFAGDNTLDFRDNVPRALIFASGQFGFVRLESFELNGAQRFGAQFLRGQFAVLSQLIVFSSNQFVFNA
jgi:hypothetical protein